MFNIPAFFWANIQATTGEIISSHLLLPLIFIVGTAVAFWIIDLSLLAIGLGGEVAVNTNGAGSSASVSASRGSHAAHHRDYPMGHEHKKDKRWGPKKRWLRPLSALRAIKGHTGVSESEHVWAAGMAGLKEFNQHGPGVTGGGISKSKGA